MNHSRHKKPEQTGGLLNSVNMSKKFRAAYPPLFTSVLESMKAVVADDAAMSSIYLQYLPELETFRQVLIFRHHFSLPENWQEQVHPLYSCLATLYLPKAEILGGS